MQLQQLQGIVGQWPGVTEDVKWGNDLVFSVANKMFCVTMVQETIGSISFKARDDEYDELSVSDGFIPAPYMARAKWVQLTDANKIPPARLEAYVRQSYELVRARLTKKLQRELEALES